MKKERIFSMDLVRVCALALIILYHFNGLLEMRGGGKITDSVYFSRFYGTNRSRVISANFRSSIDV